MNNQNLFLNAVIKLIPRAFNPTHWLSDVLGINHSSAYKKIKGLTSLNWTDIELICKALPEAMHLLPQNLGLANGFGGQITSFDGMQGLEAYLNKTAGMLYEAGRGDHQLRYVGRDLSLFFFLSKPELLGFKVALWSNRLFTHGVEPVPRAVNIKAQQLFETYLNTNSKELWYEQGAVNFAAQLRVAVLIGSLEATMAADILTLARSVLCDFSLYALEGNKLAGQFELYQVPFCTLPNSALLAVGHHSVLVSGIADVRYFSTVAPEPIAIFNKGFVGLERFAMPLADARNNKQFFEHYKLVLGKPAP